MKSSIESTLDFEWLNRMVNHPSISPSIRDDSIIGDADLSPLDGFGHIFLRLRGDCKDAGFAVMLKKDSVYEMHSGILPEYRGRFAINILREAVLWVFNNTEVDRVITWGWSKARHVLLAARLVGFHEESRSAWPNTVNGAPVERVNFYLNRSDMT